MKKETIILRTGTSKFFSSSEKSELVAVFDTSIGSFNVGDEIINKSASVILEKIFHDKQLIRFPTHVGMGAIGIDRANSASYRIVVGSNLMSGHMFRSAQWNLSPLDVFRLKSHILLGVGWQNYESDCSFTTKTAYRHLLDKSGYHSVRDEFTKTKLNEIGIDNVINTGCPTMWKLTPGHCKAIPSTKANKVIFTLTDRRRDPEADKFMVDTLLDLYEEVYLWRQGLDDLTYFRTLCDDQRVNVIAPQVSEYDKFLEETDQLDFVGTRLHAGIRALQNKHRTIVIAVDNRAREISKDTNLKIIERMNLKQELRTMIESSFVTDIKLNQEGIDKWKSQFNYLESYKNAEQGR